MISIVAQQTLPDIRRLQIYHYPDREGSTYLCQKDNVLRILFLILMMSFLSHGVCGTPILDAFNEKFNHECKSKDRPWLV